MDIGCFSLLTAPASLSAPSDEGGCGQSFTSLIVSADFARMTSLRRHRLVNTAMRDEIARVHAWSAKCQTPDEWERDRTATAGEGSTGPPLDGTVGGKVDGVKE